MKVRDGEPRQSAEDEESEKSKSVLASDESVYVFWAALKGNLVFFW